ncbi:putative quinol monooxygenase [Fulvimarina sp. 2208YS6-2-32]|uniref:Quinol monooxygenase n=1 Tax=Fulvimarina uroteuthidis TaxID=3098149 RepID=A0ABU5HZK3_9HYPH|nr:putative quinol monooxygenase [Fulvimarina sp. 2208YS6-2-32]MDY8108559.1 putative quinol monooxygenase [Fulvimarina sp. 2208YS6-2-32]
MIIIAGILRIAPADLPKVRAAAETVLRRTREEDGCIVYSFAEDLLEPGLIRIYEEWESRENLAAHGKSAHVDAWHRALETVTVLERDLDIIEAGAREALD